LKQTIIRPFPCVLYIFSVAPLLLTLKEHFQPSSSLRIQNTQVTQFGQGMREEVLENV
jgi:hypothetical protein